MFWSVADSRDLVWYRQKSPNSITDYRITISIVKTKYKTPERGVAEIMLKG